MFPARGKLLEPVRMAHRRGDGACLLAFSLWFPIPVAVLLAFCARLFLTGALHEDGLADFFDGFGGGRDREGILRIMKDSHIGSYGVLGLILYYLLAFSLLVSLPVPLIPWVLWVADPFASLSAVSCWCSCLTPAK